MLEQVLLLSAYGSAGIGVAVPKSSPPESVPNFDFFGGDCIEACFTGARFETSGAPRLG